ncbi:MAG: hypothetical protein LQ341_004627 [Variospora aurantia]|nr:MAG: hypothetical protein LQ341_004627 [Variospora aurantia]
MACEQLKLSMRLQSDSYQPSSGPEWAAKSRLRPLKSLFEGMRDGSSARFDVPKTKRWMLDAVLKIHLTCFMPLSPDSTTGIYLLPNIIQSVLYTLNTLYYVRATPASKSLLLIYFDTSSTWSLNLSIMKKMTAEETVRVFQEVTLQLAQEKAWNRSCILEEMLQESHEHLVTKFEIQTDPAKTTRGEMISIVGKSYPTTLQPWPDFLGQQQIAFDEAHTQLHPDSGPQRRFQPVTFYRGLAGDLNDIMIGGEQDLRKFLDIAVESRVKEIMRVLGSPVLFENHSRPLDNRNEEVAGRRAETSMKGAEPSMKSAASKIVYADRIRAPHKLKKEYIRSALNASLTIDVLAIRNEKRIGDDELQQFRYKAQRLVAAAATQAYHYMLEGGCKYGCIATGDVIIFLCVEEEDSTVLYYHMAEPTEEVQRHDSQLPFPYAQTTVAQLMSFCLMAAKSPQRSADWRHRAVGKAEVWRDDLTSIIDETPKALRQLAEDIDKEQLRKDGAYPGRQDKVSDFCYYTKMDMPTLGSAISFDIKA